MTTTATTGSDELPRWDLESLFGPEPDGAERAFEAALGGVDELIALFDRLGIGAREALAVDAATVAAIEAVIAGFNRHGAAFARHFNYLYCAVAADATNTALQAAMSRMQQRGADLAKLQARFAAWIGSLDVEALIAASPAAREHAYALRHASERAAHLLSPAEEDLAAELAVSGSAAWFRLREEIDASLTAPIEVDGETRVLPLTAIEGLFSRPDRDLRRRAHAAIEGARRAVETPMAAALNGVKGEQITMLRRRRWEDPLDAALALSRTDRAVLEAMMAAIRATLPEFRRYLRAKARALGVETLATYDFMAPVGATGAEWPWEDAAAFVVEQFATYTPKLAGFARRALAERWIDAGPRAGKVGGGFCANLGEGRSRILLNHVPNFVWLSALAHELGHGYHDLIEHELGRTWLQFSLTPATLAETASTFCETLVQRRALAQADPAQRLALLDGVIQGQVLNVYFTLQMYDTELALFASRAERQLSPAEITGVSLAAQRELFGEAIDAETLPRTLWVMVPHLYLPDLWYYNYPYAFGLLFGLGLFARYQAEPAGFPERFDALLADTGMATARELAARFGIDLREPAFWEAGLATIVGNFRQFEELVG